MASGATLNVFVPENNRPPATGFSTINTRNGNLVLEFDTTTQEAAVFLGVLPRHYGGGGITVIVEWAAASATTGTIGWDVAFERHQDSVDTIASDSFAAAQAIAAATVPGTNGVVRYTSVAVSSGANIDNLAAGESFRLRVRRDVANDNASGDAQLISIHLFET